MLPSADITKRGLERDIALRLASEASPPGGSLVALMGVDVGSLAFRAVRIGQDGGLLTSPGADWSKEISPSVDLMDLADLATINDSDSINTDGFAMLLLHVQANLTLGSGLAAYLQVFNALGAATEQLVYSVPVLPSNELHTHVVPVIGRSHFVRLTMPAAETGRFFTVHYQRVPPGLPIRARAWPSDLANVTDFTLATTGIGTYMNPMAPKAQLSILVDSVTGTATSFNVTAETHGGNAAAQILRTPGQVDSNDTVNAFFHSRGGALLQARITGTPPTYAATITLTPILGP